MILYKESADFSSAGKFRLSVLLNLLGNSVHYIVHITKPGLFEKFSVEHKLKSKFLIS